MRNREGFQLSKKNHAATTWVRIVVAAAVAGSAFALTGSSFGAEKETVKIGVTNASSDVDPFKSATDMVAPLATGQFDVGGGGASAGLYNAAAQAYPARIGALRLDPRSTDANYVSNLKQAFAGDVSDAEWEVVQNLLSPDDPAQPFVTPTETTRSRWGKIPWAYIKCSGDFAMRPFTQARFIDTADQFTPDNKTEVYELNTSHSPFLSQPEKLANVLFELASR